MRVVSRVVFNFGDELSTVVRNLPASAQVFLTLPDILFKLLRVLSAFHYFKDLLVTLRVEEFFYCTLIYLVCFIIPV